MTAFKNCVLHVLRYYPDGVSGQRVNLGVVLLEEGEGGFTGVRFRRDWGLVRACDPYADIELLESYEEELRRLLESRAPEIINYRGPMSRREWLLEQIEQSFSGVLTLTTTQAVLTESPQAELGKLAQIYLEPPARQPRELTGRRLIYQTMRGAFENAGVWDLMRRDIAVAPYTRRGDPLKIDCGYRPNGVVHLFHALSLAADVNSAKVLAFSYSEMRDGFMAAEHALSDLTVVTENGLDENDEGIKFASAILRENEINIAAVAEMPAIAERARLELKL